MDRILERHLLVWSVAIKSRDYASQCLVVKEIQWVFKSIQKILDFIFIYALFTGPHRSHLAQLLFCQRTIERDIIKKLDSIIFEVSKCRRIRSTQIVNAVFRKLTLYCLYNLKPF